MAWYYGVYVLWQPSIYPFAVVAVILGNLLLTLFTLWARGERKALQSFRYYDAVIPALKKLL